MPPTDGQRRYAGMGVISFSTASCVFVMQLIVESPRGELGVPSFLSCSSMLGSGLNTLNNKSACAALVIAGRTKAAILNHILFYIFRTLTNLL